MGSRFVALHLLVAMLASGLIWVAPAGLAQEPASEWQIVDDAGDQFLGVPGTSTPVPVPVPAGAATNHADLRRVAITDEDELGLNLSIRVESLLWRPNPALIGYQVQCGGSSSSSSSTVNSPLYQVAMYHVSFEREDGSVRYTLTLRVEGEMSNVGGVSVFVAQRVFGYACIQPAGAGGFTHAINMLDVSVSQADKSFYVSLTKDVLMARGPRPEFSFSRELSLPVLEAGQKLVKFVARSATGSPTAPGFSGFIFSGYGAIQDVAPAVDTGPAYTLRSDPANVQVKVKMPGGPGPWPVAAGHNQSLVVKVHNTLGAKRILVLDYDVQGPPGKPGLYRVSGPRSITVPGGEVRNFSLAVDVAREATLDDGVRVSVRAESAGFPDEVGYDVRILAGAPVLGPTSSNLFLHGRFQSLAPAVPDAAMGEACAPTLLATACWRAYLSMTETDKGAASPDRFFLPCFFGSNVVCTYPEFTHAPAAPLPIAFAEGKPVEATLKLKTIVPVDGATVLVTVSQGNKSDMFAPSELIAQGSTTASIATSGTSVTIQAPLVVKPETVLPAGTHIRIRVEVRLPAPAGTASSFGRVEVVGKESKIALPLRDLPASELGLAAATPLQLSVLGGRDDFVNPGESRLFNLTLLNQDTEPRSAHVSANVSDGWTVRVLPGADYDLTPGDTIRIGILVHAPDAAPEGQRATVLVNASTPGKPAATLRLVAISTRGVELADDSNAYQADEDTSKALSTPKPQKTPGLESVAVVAVAFAIVWRTRRRA